MEGFTIIGRIDRRVEVASGRIIPRQGLSREETGIKIPSFKKEQPSQFIFTLTILSFLFDSVEGGDPFRLGIKGGGGDGAGGDGRGGDGTAAAALAAFRSAFCEGKMGISCQGRVGSFNSPLFFNVQTLVLTCFLFSMKRL